MSVSPHLRILVGFVYVLQPVGHFTVCVECAGGFQESALSSVLESQWVPVTFGFVEIRYETFFVETRILDCCGFCTRRTKRARIENAEAPCIESPRLPLSVTVPPHSCTTNGTSLTGPRRRQRAEGRGEYLGITSRPVTRLRGIGILQL